MAEIELKFQIPTQARAAVRRAVATASAQTTRLQARYYDTPDRRLAQAGIALRLRLEGDVWVQTLKAQATSLQRLEHEVVLQQTGADARLDLSRHVGHIAGQLLTAALGDQADTLAITFETDVKRCHRLMRSGGATIEVALDVGEIRAAGTVLDLHEIEFELKSGAMKGLFAVAQRWQLRHGLWLDVRSKAERGHLLAGELKVAPPAQAGAPHLLDAMSADGALRLIVASCLDHILPNAAAMAGGVGEPEHLHQARVGLRRLRTALRVFGHWSGDVQPHWSAQAATLFGRLGATRDRDVMLASLLPQLLQAGAPAGLVADKAEPGGADDNALALREVGTGAFWLELMGFAHGEPASAAAAGHPALSVQALTAIERLQRRLVVDASHFAVLDDVQRHSTRKRVKRLRYALEFVGSLCRRKALSRCIKRLQPVQTALGDYNDLVVADTACRAWAERDPRAWYAVGWCAAKRSEVLSLATSALAAYKPVNGLARRSGPAA